MSVPLNAPSQLDPRVLERASRVIKVLGHPMRLRILEALERGELHVAELQDATGASQSVVSQQLSVLRAHGVVEARREGPRVYYRIIEPKVSRILDCIRECDLPELVETVTLVDFTMPARARASRAPGPRRTARGARRARTSSPA
jgi:DNA-binding transcriptional ArsR family regulator